MLLCLSRAGGRGICASGPCSCKSGSDYSIPIADLPDADRHGSDSPCQSGGCGCAYTADTDPPCEDYCSNGGLPDCGLVSACHNSGECCKLVCDQGECCTDCDYETFAYGCVAGTCVVHCATGPCPCSHEPRCACEQEAECGWDCQWCTNDESEGCTRYGDPNPNCWYRLENP